MVQRHLCKQLRDLISFLPESEAPEGGSLVQSCKLPCKTGEAPSSPARARREDETSQGKLIRSRCHGTRSQIMSLGFHLCMKAGGSLGPLQREPTRAVIRVTTTQGSSLSIRFRRNFAGRRNRRRWRLNPDRAAQAGPLWRLTSSTQRSGKRARKKAMGRPCAAARLPNV